MARFLVRRLIQSAFILLGVSILSFGLMRLAPGGLVAMYANPRISQATIERLEEQLGLNDPLPISYAKWLTSALRGNFGVSFIDQRPVVDKIAERLPATIELSLAALLLGLLGIPLGVFAAMHRGSWADNLIRVFTVVGNAVPHWWLGLMILVISANTVRIFPLGGMYTQGHDTLVDRLWHLALPATITAMGGWIGYSRYMRSEVLDVLGQDFVRTARAKGLSERVVLVRHVFRNALIPIVTLMGGVLAALVGGSVLFENTFSWPGIGRMAVQAAFQRDYPVLMALNMFTAFLVILGNLLADIAYGWVDPRVRYE
ncbi:MAG TPA: ABC transporter permease [Chloroflexota bacterium]|nr:ABC transporter permease [Chloroflexota bacterium]